MLRRTEKGSFERSSSNLKSLIRKNRDENSAKHFCFDSGEDTRLFGASKGTVTRGKGWIRWSKTGENPTCDMMEPFCASALDGAGVDLVEPYKRVPFTWMFSYSAKAPEPKGRGIAKRAFYFDTVAAADDNGATAISPQFCNMPRAARRPPTELNGRG